MAKLETLEQANQLAARITREMAGVDTEVYKVDIKHYPNLASYGVQIDDHLRTRREAFFSAEDYEAYVADEPEDWFGQTRAEAWASIGEQADA